MVWVLLVNFCKKCLLTNSTYCVRKSVLVFAYRQSIVQTKLNKTLHVLMYMHMYVYSFPRGYCTRLQLVFNFLHAYLENKGEKVSSLLIRWREKQLFYKLPEDIYLSLCSLKHCVLQFRAPITTFRNWCHGSYLCSDYFKNTSSTCT